MQFDLRLLKYVDKWLVLTALLLFGGGLVVIASASNVLGEGDAFVRRQAAHFAVGLALFILALVFDYSEFSRLARFFYLLNLGLLALVLVVAESAGGAQRWLYIGPVGVQVSEPAKLLMIITLAAHLAHRPPPTRWVDLLAPLLHLAPAMLLIFLQPDLGTSLVFLVILLAMLYMAGAPGWRLATLLAGGIGAMVGWVAAHLHFGVWIPLKDYQLARLITFANPDYDPANHGYQLMQSKAAISSGGLFGQGLFQGRISQSGVLPEQHTDFIFSVLGEELGFVGAAVLLFLFGFLLLRILQTAVTAKDRFGALVASGVGAMIGFHVLVNVGMTVGIMPVTGLPLPFISYGGSSLVANLAAIGLVTNVHMRRQTLMF